MDLNFQNFLYDEFYNKLPAKNSISRSSSFNSLYQYEQKFGKLPEKEDEIIHELIIDRTVTYNNYAGIIKEYKKWKNYFYEIDSDILLNV